MAAVSALLKKNLWHLRNAGRVVREQSLFKIAFILCFAVAFETGLWLIFLWGLDYLNMMGGIGSFLISRLFSLFFFGMGLMLVVSGIVTSYSTVFRSDELPFLITGPFETSQIVLYKFLESTVLSSWAFFFIVIPFVGAYAWHEDVSALFAFWTFLFSLPFLLLCSGLGTLITLTAVRWLPRGRFVRIAGAFLVALSCVALSRLSVEMRDVVGGMSFDISRVVPGLRVASHPLLPSEWLSEGIMSLSRGQYRRGILLWSTLLSTAMAVCVAVEWIGNLTFYAGWQRVVAGRGRVRGSFFSTQLEKMLSFLPNDVKALILKDIKTFFRDPAQWSQALIFFGLLGLYFTNLRSFNYHLRDEYWRNTIAFLNVFSVSSVICSLASRFIYPQLSLEGQGFWILGLSPITMTKVLAAKFFLALVGMLTVSVVLMFLSATMLNATPAAKIAAIAAACAVSFGVCGLSTGLGAVFLDLRQRNPAAIVSGFGGTLNLVLSLGFMLAVILPFALVFHLRTVLRITAQQSAWGLFWAGLWLLFITSVATVTPLWLGNRCLRRGEF